MESDFSSFSHTLCDHSQHPASTIAYLKAGIGQLLHNQPYLAIANLVHAAINGNPDAPLYIGLIFSSGYGITPQHLIALKWFARAAKYDTALSQFVLGTIFSTGLGVQRNIDTAIKWYTRASVGGQVDAQMHLGSIYCGGTEHPVNYQEAFNCFSHAATHCQAEALLAIGLLYEYGLGVVQHSAKAAWHYVRASGQGCGEASFRLGYMYILGRGMHPDYNMGISHLIDAAELGHPLATHFLTTLLQAGIKQEADKSAMAMNLFDRLAHHYYNHAQDILQRYARSPKSTHEILTMLLNMYAHLKDTPPQGPLEEKFSNLSEKDLKIDPFTHQPEYIAALIRDLNKDLAADFASDLFWLNDLEIDMDTPIFHSIENEYTHQLFETSICGVDVLSERIIESPIPQNTEKSGDEPPCNSKRFFTELDEAALMILPDKSEASPPAEKNQHLFMSEEPSMDINNVLFRKYVEREESSALHTYVPYRGLRDAKEHRELKTRSDFQTARMDLLPYMPLRYRKCDATWEPLDLAPGIEEESYHREILSRLQHKLPKPKAAELRKLERAAGKGNAAAQRDLGLLYLSGQGVAYDALHALKWLTFASEQDDPEAIYYQALIHRFGLDTIPDTPRAIQLLTRAADLNHLPAQFSLGLLLTYGPDEPGASARGVIHIKQAARRGYSPAQYMMGILSMHRREEYQNEESAEFWFREAAANEHPQAQFNLYILHTRSLTQDISAEEGFRSVKRAAHNGLARAQLYLGGCLVIGNSGETRDLATAALWLKRAAQQENRLAQFLLGLCYRRGYGLPRNQEESGKWIRHAARHICLDNAHLKDIPCGLKIRGNANNLTEAAHLFEDKAREGDADAEFNLALCHMHGWGVPKDEAQAARLFINAAQQNHGLSMFYTGYCYLHGLGVPQSDTLAHEWITRAAENEVMQAFFYLALIYFCGWGVPARSAKALYYLLRATDSNYTPAIRLTDFILQAHAGNTKAAEEASSALDRDGEHELQSPEDEVTQR